MRTLGLFCVCAAVAGCGALAVSVQRRKAETLSGFAAYVKALSFAAGELGPDLSQLLGRCAAGARRFPFAGILCELYAQTGALAPSWEEALEKCGAKKCLGAALTEQLLAFSEVFSSPSVAVFRSACGQYAASFGALAEAAEEKRARREKLVLPLAALGAALLFVILI